MTPHPSDAHGGKARDWVKAVLLAKPFRQTRLGRLPPELREKIYIELLATPPPFAGHDTVALCPRRNESRAARKKFVHIKASWYHVTRTCRQIYMESRHLFFASKCYYFEDLQDLLHLLSPRGGPGFSCDTVTALCLKNFVQIFPMYTEEQIDDIMSDPNDYRSTLYTRQELQKKTFKTCAAACICSIYLSSIKTLSLCLRVGEEMTYVDLLYCFTGMRKGLVEFVDASRWLIRTQNPEDLWSIQYACFSYADYAKGKHDEKIPYDRLQIESEVTEIDSRDPNLQEGDERYVEVQIRWPAVGSLCQGPLNSKEGNRDQETASGLNHKDLIDRGLYEDQPEVPQDNFEASERAETSEYDQILPEIEADASRPDQPLPLQLGHNDNHDSQATIDAYQEEGNSSTQPTSQEVPGSPSDTQSDHRAQDHLSSSSSAPVAYVAPISTGWNQLFLTDTDDEDDEEGADTDRIQQELNVKMKVRDRRTRFRGLSSLEKPPFSFLPDTRCPYTDEEMESYEKWQQMNISGTLKQNAEGHHQEKKPSPPSEKTHEHRMKTVLVASTSAATRKQRPKTASRDVLGLLLRYIQAGGLFILFLLLVIVPERLSSANRNRKVSSQQ